MNIPDPQLIFGSLTLVTGIFGTVCFRIEQKCDENSVRSGLYSVLLIRIRIHFGRPDPGWQTLPTEVMKLQVFKC
jgi:hypothetical protein